MDTPSNKPSRILAIISLVIGVISIPAGALLATIPALRYQLYELNFIWCFSALGAALGIISLFLAHRKPEAYGGKTIAAIALLVNALIGLGLWALYALAKMWVEIFWGG